MLNCSSEKKGVNSMKYYDWDNMLSCVKDVTIIVGNHGAGKAYAEEKNYYHKKKKTETTNVELQ